MNEEQVLGYLAKAERSLNAAELLLEAELRDSAVSRLYYGCFYIARALLLERGMEFSRHRGTIGQFGIIFARSGQPPFRSFHRLLHNLLDDRHTADYTLHPPMEAADIRALLAQGREFLAAAREYLGHR